MDTRAVVVQGQFRLMFSVLQEWRVFHVPAGSEGNILHVLTSELGVVVSKEGKEVAQNSLWLSA